MGQLVRFLYVDRRADDSRRFACLLEQSGLDVEACHVRDLAEFERQLESRRFHLALIDVGELDLLRELSARVAAGQLELPLIVCTDARHEPLALSALSLGARDYVVRELPLRFVWMAKREIQESKHRAYVRRFSVPMLHEDEPPRSFEAELDALWGAVRRWEKRDSARSSTFDVRDGIARTASGGLRAAGALRAAVHELGELSPATQGLRKLEQAMFEFVESVCLSVVVLSGTGRVAYANPHLCELLGYAREQLIGVDFRELLLPGEASLSSSVRFDTARDEGTFLDGEREVVLRSGERRYMRFNSALCHGPAGEVVGSIALGEDITGQARAQRELRESRELFALLARAANDGIWDWDLASGEVYYSARWKSLLGYHDGEIGNRLEELTSRIHHDDLPNVSEALDSFIKGRSPTYEIEHRVRHKDGNHRWLLARGSVLRDSHGKALRFVGVHVDITDRKLTEAGLRELAVDLESRVEERTRELVLARDAAESANRAKSAFLAMMSHELRTPLNAILGFSELLEQKVSGPLNENQVDQLRHIHAAGRHLLTLINDLLDLSKIEAGRLELELRQTSVAELFDIVRGMVVPLAQKAGVDLGFEPASGIPGVRLDPLRIKQVLFNLVANAIKFTPRGGQVRVAASADDHQLCLWVEDTGVGIRAEDMPRLFREFEQLRRSADHPEGTGLGLALCRRLVELHGGHITVRSEEGVGSTFSVWLPTFSRSERASVRDPAAALPGVEE